MRETLLAMFGLYGGTLAISFVAGMFPLVSIELFLIFVMTYYPPGPAGFVALVLLAAFGHQIAKTITFYMGVGALENNWVKPRVDKVRARIDRWNKRPKLILFIAATIGLPPLWVMGFIAHPLMKMRIAPFTLIVFFGRIGRYAFLMLIPVVVG